MLNSHTDFRNERSIIENLVMERGHLLIHSPAYYPDIAGLGIEFDWGKSKLDYRRYINDMVASNLRKNVCVAIGDCGYRSLWGEWRLGPLTLARTRRFARRGRTNRKILESISDRATVDKCLTKWKSGKLEVHGKKIKAPSPETFAGMDKLFKAIYTEFKTHRNMIDTCTAICGDHENHDVDAGHVSLLNKIVIPSLKQSDAAK